MKILLINACHYLRGGSETVYFNTARLLKDKGHEVYFFSTSDPQDLVSEFNKYFTSISSYRNLSLLEKITNMPSYIYNREAVEKLERLLSDYKPDVAHVHLFYAVLSVSILKVLKKHGIPVVHTVHDYRLICPVNTFIDRHDRICEMCRDKHFIHCTIKRCKDGNLFQSMIVTLEAYFWKYFESPIKYIDHYIFVSNFSLQKHLDFNEKFRGKYTQLYNFTNVRSNRDIVKGDYFLYFGRLSKEKGVKTLISTFSKIKDKKLKIAGNGPLRGLVEDSAKENQNIEYVGFKTGSDLESLIRNAYFVILPSECYENNPLSLIEAFNSGKPVIGAEIAGIPELIENGKNGFLFKSGSSESLELVLKSASTISEEDYLNYSLTAFGVAQSKFSVENHYLKLMQVYHNVLNEKVSE